MFDSILIEKMFQNRGITPERFAEINKSEHRVLGNTEPFITRLHELHESQELVVILSDFDMDGISSGVVGYAGLAEMGFNAGLFLPNPQKGYGFDASTIDELHAAYPMVRTVITCDVGVTCHDGIDRANALNIEVLVTDHHAPDDKKPLPNARCVVDPKCEDPNIGYEHQGICGAYVLYQLLESYAVRYHDRFTVEQIRRLQVFAGMGTISDGMPLLYENRKLVQNAMTIAKMIYASGSDFLVNCMTGSVYYRRAFKGLYLVLKAFADAGTLKAPEDITSEFFAFYVAPMFNSVKRIGLDTDMNHAFGVFFGPTPEDSISYLMNLNVERKAVVAEHFQKLQNSQQPYAPYVYLSDAPSGVLGLLAQKQMSVTEMPCCVVALDGVKWHGSGRSLPWYPLRSRALQKDFYVAGHDEAFGVGLANTAELRKFYEFVKSDYESVLGTVDMDAYSFKPDFVIAHDGSGDTVIDIVLFMEFLDELKWFAPFGPGFPAPQILLRFRASDGEWRVMGSMKQHASVVLEYGFKVVLFNQASAVADIMNTDKMVSVVGHLSVNEFRDTRTMQFIGDIMPE